MLGRVWVVLLLAAGVGPAAVADFEEGAEAARRGDYETALALLRPLAESDDPVAQLALGRLHAEGRGTKLDHEAAVRWYRRAAEQGYAPAQYRLGLHHYAGLGVPEDRIEAFFWIGLARIGGLEDAHRWIQEVDTRLEDDEEAELRRRLTTWQPRARRPPDPQPSASPGAAAPDVAARAVTTASHVVQLGSLRSEQAAHREWARLHAAHGDLLADLVPSVVRVELGAPRGVFFRVRAGPLPNRTEAEALCRALERRSVPCIVIASGE